MPYMPQNYGSPVTPTPGGTAPIQGQLPFAQPNVGGMFGGDLAGSYQSAYNTALGQNQANYSNILSGYQQTLQQQQGAQQAIAGGYNQLYNNVLSGIQGIGQSQAQAIADQYAQQQGSSQQDLINRGLGNSTVLSSVQRGLTLDKSKADIALSNQIAQLNAGYQSSLGMAGLNYANQAAMQNSAQQNQQLGFMNSVQSQYPNADAYSRLYQQQGAMQQANANRAQSADQFNQMMAASRAAQSAGMGGGSMANRPGGGGLGPGVFGGAGSAAGGGMSSVTPFGVQGSMPNFNPNFGTSNYGAPSANMTGMFTGAAGSMGGVGGYGQKPPWDDIFGATTDAANYAQSAPGYSNIDFGG